MGIYPLTGIRFGAILPQDQRHLNASYIRQDHYTKLPGYMEYADFLFEKAYNGDLDVDLPYYLRAKLDNVISRKKIVHPPRKNQLKEEIQEVIDEAPLGSPSQDTVLRDELSSKVFGMSNHYSVVHAMNWPYKSPSQFIQFSIEKIEGRMAAEEMYPKMPEEKRKSLMKEFESNAARFNFR